MDTLHDRSGYSTTQQEDFRILKCLGCSAVYFQHESVFSEDWETTFNPKTGEHEDDLRRVITHWPTPEKRKVPDWFYSLEDENLRNILRETYRSHDDGRATLAAIGVRTALDRAFVLHGADPNSTFPEKLKHLEDSGLITAAERTFLEHIKNAGNAAAHRAWAPKPEVLMKMIEHMEAFLHRVFAQDAEAKLISEATPTRSRQAGGRNT